MDHLKAETFPQLSALDGYVDATILRRRLDRGVEFLIVTTWQSLDAIKLFAGEDISQAVVPPKIQAMMIEFDGTCTHYQVAYHELRTTSR